MAAEWYHQSEGQPSGPVDSRELRRLAEAGIVRPDTLVRKGASGNWVRAEQVRGLFQPVDSPPVAAVSHVEEKPNVHAAASSVEKESHSPPPRVPPVSTGSPRQKYAKASEPFGILVIVRWCLYLMLLLALSQWMILSREIGLQVSLFLAAIFGITGPMDPGQARIWAGIGAILIGIMIALGFLAASMCRHWILKITTQKITDDLGGSLKKWLKWNKKDGQLRRNGLGAAAVNEASEKPERIGPVTWAAIIVGSGTVLLLLWALLVLRGGSAPQPVSQEAAEQTSWKDYPLAEQIEAGGPPIGVSPEIFEKSKNEAKERFEKLPGVTEHKRKFEQLILDWVDDHQGQPLPEQQVMSGWIQEMRAELRRELVASPEVQAVMARMKQLEEPEGPESAALQHEFERLTQQWMLRRMDADKLLAEFDRKYQRWLQDSQRH